MKKCHFCGGEYDPKKEDPIFCFSNKNRDRDIAAYGRGNRIYERIHANSRPVVIGPCVMVPTSPFVPQ